MQENIFQVNIFQLIYCRSDRNHMQEEWLGREERATCQYIAEEYIAEEYIPGEYFQETIVIGTICRRRSG